MTKYYIGNILDIHGGVVRMLNTKQQLVPHVNGGANSKEDELTFVSYDESEVNKEAMARNGLRFLTQEEVAHFMRGENIKGEKLEAPKVPVISYEERKEMIEEIKKALEERKANGESYDFLIEVLNGLTQAAE